MLGPVPQPKGHRQRRSDGRTALELRVGHWVTYRPRKSFVLTDVWDIQWLHSISDVLSIHVIDSVCIAFPVEIRDMSSFCEKTWAKQS